MIRLPDGVTRTVTPTGLVRYDIDTPQCTGSVYELGATVTSWAPRGARDVLWVSAESPLEVGRPIRGGIPICAPWFSGGRDGVDVPQPHGFVRNTPWELTDAWLSDDGVALTFDLIDTADLPGAEDYPVDLRFRYDVTFGEALGVALTIGSEWAEFVLDEALHTYFAVPDVTQAVVRGLDGVPFLDKVSGADEQIQRGDLTFAGHTDLVFETTGATSLVTPDRVVHIEKSGSATTVVWNPWAAGAASMTAFGADEWSGMVCVETANALADAVTVRVGEPHVMTTRLTVG